MEWDNPTDRGHLAAVPDLAIDHLNGRFQELGVHDWPAQDELASVPGTPAAMVAALIAAVPALSAQLVPASMAPPVPETPPIQGEHQPLPWQRNMMEV